MPVYREEIVDSKWGSKRHVRNAADVLRRAKARHLAKLGKLTCNYSAAKFPHNDPKLLTNAIAAKVKLMKVRAGYGGAASAAVVAMQKPIEVRKYLGKVKSLDGDNVIAEIGPVDDMDRWDVVIPRASFREEPQVDQEIDCSIFRWGSHTDVIVRASSNKRLPELQDFGIDETELLTWASQVDV